MGRDCHAECSRLCTSSIATSVVKSPISRQNCKTAQNIYKQMLKKASGRAGSKWADQFDTSRGRRMMRDRREAPDACLWHELTNSDWLRVWRLCKSLDHQCTRGLEWPDTHEAMRGVKILEPDTLLHYITFCWFVIVRDTFFNPPVSNRIIIILIFVVVVVIISTFLSE